MNADILTALETAASQLGVAYGAASAASQVNQQAAYAATGRTDKVVGMDRLDRALAGRLASLGLEHMLDAHVPGTRLGPEWVGKVQS